LRVQRLDFARRLIDETDLPFTEVAASAGFRSIRRFNDAVKARFGKPPSALRKRPKNHSETIHTSDADRQKGQGALVLRLPYRPPLAWSAMLQFLSARAIAGVEAINANSYQRTVTMGKSDGWIEVRPAKVEGSLELHLHVPQTAALSSGLLEAVERVRTLFDLEADPLRIAAQLEKDPRLQKIVADHPGLRVPGGWDGFELAIRAVLGQQVSVKGASTLCARLVQGFGTPLSIPDAPNGLTHTFPSAALLATSELQRIGIPKARARALQELAKRVADGQIVLNSGVDLVETERQLLEVPGIGPWTAQYIAMRVLRDPDAIPVSDLVLKRCLGSGNADDLRPWRAYAAMYLWQSASQTEKSS
jgi:AraC family transcriptional regulator of adaptative response / DNA-3-methyladenine glycosylase II